MVVVGVPALERHSGAMGEGLKVASALQGVSPNVLKSGICIASTGGHTARVEEMVCDTQLKLRWPCPSNFLLRPALAAEPPTLASHAADASDFNHEAWHHAPNPPPIKSNQYSYPY